MYGYERNFIHEAIVFAAKKYGSKTRELDGISYYAHATEVMHSLSEDGCSPDTVIAGILHDVVNATDTTIKEVERKFKSKVAQIVGSMTEKSSKNWLENKKELLKALPGASLESRLVCCADAYVTIETIRYAIDKQGDDFWKELDKEQFKEYFIELVNSLRSLEFYPTYWGLEDMVQSVFSVNFQKLNEGKKIKYMDIDDFQLIPLGCENESYYWKLKIGGYEEIVDIGKYACPGQIRIIRIALERLITYNEESEFFFAEYDNGPILKIKYENAIDVDGKRYFISSVRVYNSDIDEDPKIFNCEDKKILQQIYSGFMECLAMDFEDSRIEYNEMKSLLIEKEIEYDLIPDEEKYSELKRRNERREKEVFKRQQIIDKIIVVPKDKGLDFAKQLRRKEPDTTDIWLEQDNGRKRLLHKSCYLI